MRIPFAPSFAALFSARRRMRADWDLRARRDARLYIDCGHGATEESFWRSGEEDLSNHILRDLDIDRSASVLEIGCGIGRLLRPMSERVAHATGVDISAEMIRLAQEALAGRPNVRLLITDGDLAGVADASLDLVYSHIVFQHVPSRKAVSRYFAEAARVLKGGGVFRLQVDGRPRRLVQIVNTWNGVRYEAGSLRRELAAHSFDVISLTGERTQYTWATAARRPESGRASTAAVVVRRRTWNAEALDRLLARLGSGAATERDRLLSGAVELRELVEPLIARHRADPPRDYVAAVYRVLLGRDPDEGGLAYYAGEIEHGTRRSNVVDCLLASAEFDARHRQPLAPASTASSHGL